MSQITPFMYRDESGNEFFPFSPGLISTHCSTVQGLVPKLYLEVLIHWNGTNYVEDPVYLPGQSIPVLKILNLCDNTFAYIKMTKEEFFLMQKCCVIQELEEEEGFIITEDDIIITTEDGVPLIKE